MKLILAVCVAVCAVGVYGENTSSAEKRKEMDKIMDECISKNNVDKEKITEEIKKNHIIPNNPEMKGYLACMMKKTGMMNDDGTMTKKFTESTVGAVCKDLSGDENEVAYKVGNCVLKNDLKKQLADMI